MRILVIGPQGSGKTTQARKIAEQEGLCLVKTGDIIRAKAQEDTPEGKLLKDSLEKGNLSDDEIVARLVSEKVNSPECQNGFVVDGYPRRLSQIHVFDPEYTKVIYLKLSDEVARARMVKRARVDDTPELIDERLKVYYQESLPVIDYFKQKGLLTEINGEKSEQEVYGQIKDAIQ